MAKEEKQLVDTVIENQEIIHHNLCRVHDILAESLAGDDWDRITAIGMAGKLLDVCRQDVKTNKTCVQQVKEDTQK